MNDPNGSTMGKRQVVEYSKDLDGIVTISEDAGAKTVKIGKILDKFSYEAFTKKAKMLAALISDPKVRDSVKGILKVFGILLLVVFVTSWDNQLKAAELESLAEPNETPDQKLKRETLLRDKKIKINTANSFALAKMMSLTVQIVDIKGNVEETVSGMVASPQDISKSEFDRFVEDMINVDISANRAMEIIQKIQDVLK
jgi:hypothetical protein